MAHQTTGSFQSHPLCSEENFNAFSFLVLGSSNLPINTNHIFLLQGYDAEIALHIIHVYFNFTHDQTSTVYLRIIHEFAL